MYLCQMLSSGGKAVRTSPNFRQTRHTKALNAATIDLQRCRETGTCWARSYCPLAQHKKITIGTRLLLVPHNRNQPTQIWCGTASKSEYIQLETRVYNFKNRYMNNCEKQPMPGHIMYKKSKYTAFNKKHKQGHRRRGADRAARLLCVRPGAALPPAVVFRCRAFLPTLAAPRDPVALFALPEPAVEAPLPGALRFLVKAC